MGVNLACSVTLLADGMTNREIAERMAITPGTTGIHVEHILRKVDMKSRHQVGAWAKAQGLAGFKQRLAAIDTKGWSASQRGDSRLVEADSGII